MSLIRLAKRLILYKKYGLQQKHATLAFAFTGGFRLKFNNSNISRLAFITFLCLIKKHIHNRFIKLLLEFSHKFTKWFPEKVSTCLG